ncbi:SRPBCC family protein [Roseomonas hellenica]|uniref:SRPBCC family protein n=1 Tax=Plastoroseomonas hellenica TaxID=2687306 RepID=A0ABS5EX00_9PROT|nr:SRPBCC family protein [Plastoroseomonas hellenica]MBR0664833.1 SRPBCC family protein [Plastoroseomonas hellenica]
MASIHWEEPVRVSAEHAWAALRRPGDADRLFAGVLVDGRVCDDIHTVTFASGLVVRERIIDIDDDRRRLAYAVIDGAFEHHAASMQIFPVDEANCRFVWISDFLPEEKRAAVLPLVREGSRALARNLEAGLPP